MMPNVTRGSRMAGLMTYLVGPGRANEHTEPHLVAGDHALMVWHDDAELNRDSGLNIARHLDRPQTAYDVDFNGGHVWHCSLSLRAEEGLLSDEKWGAIARDFITAMEFDDVEGSKSPCRWVAVRHGVSKAGNDHIHIAVNLVREDGTKASIHNDFRRAQNAARALEVKYGLEELESAKAERATRGYHPAERQAQARARARAKYEQSHTRSEGSLTPWEDLSQADRRARINAEMRTEEPRYAVARTVRASAAASDSESEFVRRMRRSGLLVRPRYADGRTDVITGYSVAERPVAGERPIWYGGGRLGRDLTLPRLRSGWPDTPMGASEAAAEWNAARRGRRVVSPGRETTEPHPEMWERYSRELGALRQQLQDVPLTDRDTWATLARQTAGAFAAWSNAVEDTPGDLAAAADALSKSAQTFHKPERVHKAGRVALSGAAMVLASAAKGGQGKAAQLIMLRQLVRLSQAVYDAAKATGQKRQADLILNDVRARMNRLRISLTPQTSTAPQATESAVGERVQTVVLDPEARAMLDRVNASQAKPATDAGSPIPHRLQPTERAPSRHGTGTGPQRGVER